MKYKTLTILMNWYGRRIILRTFQKKTEYQLHIQMYFMQLPFTVFHDCNQTLTSVGRRYSTRTWTAQTDRKKHQTCIDNRKQIESPR